MDTDVSNTIEPQEFLDWCVKSTHLLQLVVRGGRLSDWLRSGLQDAQSLSSPVVSRAIVPSWWVCFAQKSILLLDPRHRPVKRSLPVHFRMPKYIKRSHSVSGRCALQR